MVPRRSARFWVAHLTPVVVVAVAAAALVAWLIVGMDRDTISSGGGTSPVIAEPAFTPDDIDRIAGGEPADPARPDEAVLTRAILDAAWVYNPEYPGVRAVDVGFASAPGRRWDRWSIGWPVPWVARIREPNYEDAVRREGFKATVTDPTVAPVSKWERPRDPLNIPPRRRWDWYGRVLHYQPAPEQTGGVTTTWQINVFAPIVLLGAVVLTWYVCGLAVWVLNRFRARERRWRGRRLQVGVAVVVVLGFVLASILTAGREAGRLFTFPKLTQVGVPPTPVIWKREGFARLPFTRDELEQMAADPAADARVAAAIRDLDRPIPASDVGGRVYLAAAMECETQYNLVGNGNPRDCTLWTFNRAIPMLLVQRTFYVRRPDFGTPELVAPPAGLRFASYHGWAGLSLSTGDPDTPVYRVLVEPTILAAVIVVLWLVFWTTRLITVVRGRIVRAGRLRRGCCPACAYPLPPAVRARQAPEAAQAG